MDDFSAGTKSFSEYFEAIKNMQYEPDQVWI